MARNKITDLRDHLFAQLENLSDDELMLDPERREREIARSKQIVNVSSAIVETVKVEIDFLHAISKSDNNEVIDTSFIITKSPDQKRIN